MSLIKLSKANPDGFEDYLARQIVAFAGDGQLRDNSNCAAELRAFLKTVSSERLARYASECLEQSFNESGLVLQDVVNELGTRLEFDVENGRYRGTAGQVGADGVWRSTDGPAILIEVKTTDTYSVSLETVAGYRKSLIASEAIDPQSSILFVVGRKDTGSLEAQIRGSRFAWDMRVVGVDSLIKLVRVKEKSSEDQTIHQIRELLRPFEYTRVDRILDVVFSAATDVVDSTDEIPSTVGPDSSGIERTSQEKIEEIRLASIDALNQKIDANLVRKRQALFSDEESNVKACVTVSKRYDNNVEPYWYAFHPKWDEFLSGGVDGYVVFGCVDRMDAYAIPLATMKSYLPSLNRTENEGGGYWHVKLAESTGGMALSASKTGQRFPLNDYKIEWK